MEDGEPLAFQRHHGIHRQHLSTNNHLIVGPLLIVASVAVVFILYEGRDVLVPFVIALFLTYLLRPIVNAMTTPFEVCRRKVTEVTYFGRDSLGLSKNKNILSDLESEHVSGIGKGDNGSSGGSGDEYGKNANVNRNENYQRSERSADTNSDNGSDDENTSLIDKEDESHRPHGIESLSSIPAARAKVTGSINYTHRGQESRRSTLDDGPCDSCLQLPHPLAVLITMLVAVSILGFGLLLVADTVRGFEEEDLILYKKQGSVLLNQTLFWVKGSFQVDGTYLLQQIITRIPLSDLFQGVIMFCVNTMANIFWILLFVLYLLFEQTKPTSRRSTVSHSHHHIRQEIDEQIQRYLGLKTLVSVLAAASVYFLLGPMLRVRMAHLFGIFTFFLNFIPNAGPLLATFLPLPIVILDPSLLPISKILAIAGPVFIHAVIGNVIEPAVFGASLELHPIMVLLSLAFWYLVWGSAGAILSVPITAVVRIVLLHTDGVYAQSCLALLEGRLYDIGRSSRSKNTSII